MLSNSHSYNHFKFTLIQSFQFHTHTILSNSHSYNHFKFILIQSFQIHTPSWIISNSYSYNHLKFTLIQSFQIPTHTIISNSHSDTHTIISNSHSYLRPFQIHFSPYSHSRETFIISNHVNNFQSHSFKSFIMHSCVIFSDFYSRNYAH